jgi:sulfur-oxidizing protein SoxY
MMMYSDTLTRRSFLQTCAAAAVGVFVSGTPVNRLLATTLGPEDPEVPNEEVARILQRISGGRPIRRGHVSLDMPVVAEDGRVVPVMVETDLPQTADRYVKAVHLVVDHNPDPHLAAFHLTPTTGSASITTRIKMKRTTWVRAIVETSTGEIWADYSRVRVSLNGCG